MFLASKTFWWKLSWMENNFFSTYKQYFRKSFKFHSCPSFDRELLIKFPKFYKNILFQWSSSLSAFFELPSRIMSNFLWFNKDILIEKKSIFFRYFSDKGFNFVYQLFNNNGSVESWSIIKEKFDFNNISNFIWQQIIHVIPPFWKKIIKETDNADNILLSNYHLIQKNTNWYWETTFKAIILSPCIHPSLYTNISEVF